MSLVEVCRKLISIDSCPTSSTVELVDYLAQLAEQAGLQAEVMHEVQNGITQANIIVRTPDHKVGDREFLLQTHLDTVDPGNFALWKKNDFNPYDAVIEDGKIYGLGAAEVKLDFICKLNALAKMKDKPFNALKPVLVGTFGEETGMQGALKLVRKNKINAKYALIGETSDLKIINAAKGFAVVEVRIPISEEEVAYKQSRELAESTTTQTKVFSGRSAHSSTPHLGDNAIQKMLDFLQKMPENMVLIEVDGGTRFNMIPSQAMVELEMVSHIKNPTLQKLNKIYKVIQEVDVDMRLLVDEEFEPSHSTWSAGIIRTQTDSILLGGSCRILPNVTQEQYELWMKKIQQVCEECGAQFRITDYKRPYRTNDSSVLIKSAQSILEKMGLEPRCVSLASTNEASLFTRLDIECICFGAGVREGNVHTPEEHVKIEDLEKATAFYEQMIERFCL
ncbi:M20 family metallopeptidase [Pseudobdellovibrio exovorus]|uniref:Succinyl-diaminopimelate desuccinylase n=1 Tax=Pseudobdellovibrio exovorus JSS TaxID=1184267 RepID=M4VEW3_9BACT|nr:M20/M25/M40 family metallo-hydrolase [Pseudobdellovibrio exovorus]AGH96576.1 succinyl-diaminopimelate desuccinylase [Pseudobdellovibrio exovorus JSS]